MTLLASAHMATFETDSWFWHLSAHFPHSWHPYLPGVSTAAVVLFSQFYTLPYQGSFQGFWLSHTKPCWLSSTVSVEVSMSPLLLNFSRLKTSITWTMPRIATDSRSNLAFLGPGMTAAAWVHGWINTETGIPELSSQKQVFEFVMGEVSLIPEIPSSNQILGYSGQVFYH